MPSTVQRIRVSSYVIPTDGPESDGTLEWSKTTLVLVEALASGHWGLGYTYADRATAVLVDDVLRSEVEGRGAMDVPAVYAGMVKAVRNHGQPGVAAMAISAVDAALWDLKARILGLPLVTVLGAARSSAPVYGSGGFTSYSVTRLCDQLGGWVGGGIPRVKMKVGLFIIFGHFGFPFLTLITYAVKRRRALLAFMAAWLLVAQYFEVHWLIAPERDPSSVFAWWDPVAVLAVGGLSLALALWTQRGRLLAPVFDRRFPEAVRYESW